LSGVGVFVLVYKNGKPKNQLKLYVARDLSCQNVKLL